jgi:aquaporin Z
MVYAGGHISGAHYNPAVTLAMVLVKRQTLPDAGLFIASQLAGGFMAGISAVALLDGEIGMSLAALH